MKISKFVTGSLFFCAGIMVLMLHNVLGQGFVSLLASLFIFIGCILGSQWKKEVRYQRLRRI